MVNKNGYHLQDAMQENITDEPRLIKVNKPTVFCKRFVKAS
jgi:hypothetical protein